MSSVLKKIALVGVALVGLMIIAIAYAIRADERRLHAATNPCEHDCLLDSGGVEFCRQLCASHPLTYGPASQPSAH